MDGGAVKLDAFYCCNSPGFHFCSRLCILTRGLTECRGYKVPKRPLKLELSDVTLLAIDSETGGGGVIIAIGPDDREIEIHLTGTALMKLEAFIGRANLEQAKLQPKH